MDKESVEKAKSRASFDPAQMKRFYFEQEELSFVDSWRTCSLWISWFFVLDRGLTPSLMKKLHEGGTGKPKLQSQDALLPQLMA